MKYLFFDLEFATTRNGMGKVCEFGYTVTDETFAVLERGNLIINPNIGREEWDYYSVKKILTRSITDYESKENFISAYPTIYRLISGADHVFGHSMDCDVKFLNCDIERYRLPAINYSFYDIKKIFRKLTETPNDTSVSGMLEYFGIASDESVHDAGGDAFNTMLALKSLLSFYHLTAEEAIRLCPESRDETTDLVVSSIARREEEKEKKRLYYETHYLSENHHRKKRKGKKEKDAGADADTVTDGKSGDQKC